MNRIFSFFNCILFTLVLVPGSLAVDLQLSGNGYLEYSIDRETEENYFENWTDIYLGYQDWRLGARHEFHLPPQPYSRDSTGQGVSQRYLEYRRENLIFTVGNFYTLFGKGLVLRLFDNRVLRWDSNLDGVRLSYYHSKVNIELIGGRPRDRRGRRRAPLQGATLTIKPGFLFQFGGNFVTSKLNNTRRSNWGSAFTELNLSWSSFYLEAAMNDFQDRGEAIYTSGNLFIGSFTVLVEYKNYRKYDLTRRISQNNIPSEMTYNNPPAVYREHRYTLMNRHQPNQNADDERGYLVEVNYAWQEQTIFTLSHSHTENHDDIRLYQEYYGQVEWNPAYHLNIESGIGRQEDPEARYLNFVGKTSVAISDYNSIRAIFEHQHAKITFNDRQFYNQALTLSFDHSPTYSLSLLTERTTDQQAARNIWLAGQLDFHFLDNFDFTLFVGRRRAGKICIGGICINRPAFEGIEFRLINRF
jgi:hypothetical protein